jgi:hypothetical protein
MHLVPAEAKPLKPMMCKKNRLWWSTWPPEQAPNTRWSRATEANVSRVLVLVFWRFSGSDVNYQPEWRWGWRSSNSKTHGRIIVTTPLWPSVGVKPNTSKVGDLESSGTPECLEFDRKAQNTSHWCVLGVIGKVLKRRYIKWPRIGHLDICSSSYGQKKGRESNCQFDSRPLKFGNRPLPDLRIKSAIRRWKDLDEG